MRFGGAFIVAGTTPIGGCVFFFMPYHWRGMTFLSRCNVWPLVALHVSQTVYLFSFSCWLFQISIKTLCQLEKDTLVVAYEDSAKFVNLNGQMKQSTRQASILTFEPPPHHIVCLQGSVLSFHRHGMLGKSLSTRQVIAQVSRTVPARAEGLSSGDGKYTPGARGIFLRDQGGGGVFRISHGNYSA